MTIGKLYCIKHDSYVHEGDEYCVLGKAVDPEAKKKEYEHTLVTPSKIMMLSCDLNDYVKGENYLFDLLKDHKIKGDLYKYNHDIIKNAMQEIEDKYGVQGDSDMNNSSDDESNNPIESNKNVNKKKNKTEIKKKRFNCKPCKFNTDSKYNYDVHLKSNKHEKLTNNRFDEELKCEYCGDIFSFRSSLSRHENHRCPKNNKNKLAKNDTNKAINYLIKKVTNIEKKLSKK